MRSMRQIARFGEREVTAACTALGSFRGNEAMVMVRLSVLGMAKIILRLQLAIL